MQGRRRHIGIFGGSFNPVHCGHLMVATYMASWTDLDEVWLTLSPQNPLKQGQPGQISDADRLAMLRLATEGATGLKVCDVELSLPRPSYTINTLRHLAASYPDCNLSLIIGSDNWQIFNRWREADEIITRFGVKIYPRPGYTVDSSDFPDRVELVDAPVCSLSSTFIRESVHSGHLIEHMVPGNVLKYISEHKLYDEINQ